MIQDVVAPVVVNQRDHRKRFPGLSPQRAWRSRARPHPRGAQTGRPGQASAAPVAKGPPIPMDPPVRFSQPVGRRARAGHDCGHRLRNRRSRWRRRAAWPPGRPHLPSPPERRRAPRDGAALRGRIRQGVTPIPPSRRTARPARLHGALQGSASRAPLGGEIAGHALVGEKLTGASAPTRMIVCTPARARRTSSGK